MAGVEVNSAGFGVHVGGSWNGVTVEICNAGPSGSLHFPRHNQMTNPIKEQARTERNERVAFWEFVIPHFVCATNTGGSAQRESLKYMNHIRGHRRKKIYGDPGTPVLIVIVAIAQINP